VLSPLSQPFGVGIGVGAGLGAFVGTGVGVTVGVGVGSGVGVGVGAGVGVAVGAFVGVGVGTGVGPGVGTGVGVAVGTDVGTGVGVDVGEDVGANVASHWPGATAEVQTLSSVIVSILPVNPRRHTQFQISCPRDRSIPASWHSFSSSKQETEFGGHSGNRNDKALSFSSRPHPPFILFPSRSKGVTVSLITDAMSKS